MNDLESFRDHARKMSTAQHKPECSRLVSGTMYGRPVFNTASPDPECPGCISAADRELWTRLADEADAFLTREPEPDLFGATP